MPVASFTITKLAWLRRCEPEVFGRVAPVAAPPRLAHPRLTGGHTTDRGDASGTGWWSPAEGALPAPTCSTSSTPTCGWDAMLPEVLGPTEAGG